MSAIEVPGSRTRTRRLVWVTVAASLVAGVLFLGSAGLQLAASIQRWVVFSASRTANDISVEDHRFDYFFPWDPWEPIGTAAELYGTGTVIMAVGLLVMPLGVSTRVRPATDREGVVLRAVSETVLAAVVAGALAIHGAHAVSSGIHGAPSGLQIFLAVGWVAVAGLITLSVLWRRISRPAAVACLFLIGNTLLGYLVATYGIAPLFTGGSHDTAAWSETVVAVSVGGAGIAMIIAAATAVRR